MKTFLDLIQKPEGNAPFYKLIEEVEGTVSFIKKSANYADNYSGICHFIYNGEKQESWVNLSSTDRELVKLGAQNTPVFVQLLEVAETADPALLEQYGKVIGDRVLRFVYA